MGGLEVIKFYLRCPQNLLMVFFADFRDRDGRKHEKKPRKDKQKNEG